MSWVVTAVVGTVVATTAYSADQNRKAIHAQQDAINAAQAEDARKAAEAETNAQVAANARLADSKRRRTASALALGNPNGAVDTLGGGSTALSAGVSPAARAAYYASGSAGAPAGTALGAGAGASGRKFIPSTPSRATAV